MPPDSAAVDSAHLFQPGGLEDIGILVARTVPREFDFREQAARTKLRRTFTAARTASRELAALYAPHARGRATGGSGKRRPAVAASVLEELTAMPLELIGAGRHPGALKAGNDSLVMLHRLATWRPRPAARTRSSSSTATCSRKLPLSIDARTSNGKRLGLTWHPIFTLSDAEVWEEIAAEGLEYHPATTP